MKKSSIQKKFGLAIQKIRKERKISQEKLALESCIDRRYLSDIENGKRNVSIDIIERLAIFFNLQISELFQIAEKTFQS